jgi:hypothetical protein
MAEDVILLVCGENSLRESKQLVWRRENYRVESRGGTGRGVRTAIFCIRGDECESVDPIQLVDLVCLN